MAFLRLEDFQTFEGLDTQLNLAVQCVDDLITNNNGNVTLQREAQNGIV